MSDGSLEAIVATGKKINKLPTFALLIMDETWNISKDHGRLKMVAISS